jgi:hypothetical protein
LTLKKRSFFVLQNVKTANSGFFMLSMGVKLLGEEVDEMYCRAAFLFLLLCLGVVATQPLRAEEGYKLMPAERRLARHLAAVAANEGALQSPRDLELIWQATQFHGDTAEAQDRWLRRHSGRVLGTKTCLEGNCLWSSQLGRGEEVPEAVPAEKRDYWRVTVLPLYRGLLQRARRLVAGARYRKPCHIEPRTWGGVGRADIDDREHAAGEGLYPIGCEGTLNDGFAPRSAFP